MDTQKPRKQFKAVQRIHDALQSSDGLIVSTVDPQSEDARYGGTEAIYARLARVNETEGATSSIRDYPVLPERCDGETYIRNITEGVAQHMIVTMTALKEREVNRRPTMTTVCRIEGRLGIDDAKTPRPVGKHKTKRLTRKARKALKRKNK